MQTEQKAEKLILASASPRRRELLASMGLAFDLVVPEVDETPFPNENPQSFAERLAEQKAHAVHVEGTVIAADTIVVKDNMIMGKPSNSADACAMLRSLSDAVHEVLTAVCVKNRAHVVIFSVVTKVAFRKLEMSEIEAYVATGEPMDKAGAYAIQGGAAHMVRAIEGSYTNVVGLPLCELHEALASI